MVNAAERAEIEHNANIRNLTVGDFMRRAGLGRKADVRYDTQIVLAVTELVQSIRTLNVDLLSMQTVEMDANRLDALLDTMRQIVGEAKAALLRIDK
ncbi:MAG: hypothetical protein BGO63_11250 [Candidatus Accumulibacter sp. 66-26]|nr:MAG: hypothetical protein BGO63_11250 [Candidatus Accumulibacter sp. 66-26]